MKTIKVDDDMYNFLIELSNELNTQDNRATALPYFFQIQETKRVITTDDNDEHLVVWLNDDFEPCFTGKDEERDAMFKLCNRDLDNEEDHEWFDELLDCDIEDIMNLEGYSKFYYRNETIKTNSFLTEKACHKHIKANHYHYDNPVSFLSHAFRNPELEKVMKFISDLTKKS